MTKKSFNISLGILITLAVVSYKYITSAVPLTLEEISSTNYHIGTNTIAKT